MITITRQTNANFKACIVRHIFFFLSAFFLIVNLNAQIQFEQVPSPIIADFEGVLASAVAFADVDGDGDKDVLITGQVTLNLLIAKLYKNENGIFTEVLGTPFIGLQEGSIAFADIDGDGDQDLLMTGGSSYFYPYTPTTKLYANDGSGNFTEVTGTPFDDVVFSSVAFADVDGDGDPDVLITGLNSSDQPIAKLYTNNGSGTFTLANNTPFEGVEYSSIAFADVDGDGDDDVLITGRNSSNQRISKLYTNDGSGSFGLANGTPFEGVNSSSIAFADVDGDGDQDVLISGSNNSNQPITKLYTNNGSGAFTLVTGTPFDGLSRGSIAFSDVDGDGDPDVLITGYNNSSQKISKLYTNDGNGIFTVINGTPFERVYQSSIAFADVDGDGDEDVLIAGRGNLNNPSSKLYSNDGSGNFALVTGTPFEGVYSGSISFADVDGDGDPDVLITGRRGHIPTNPSTQLYNNDGSGGFSVVTNTPFEGVYNSSTAFADIDGDGDQDVLITGINSNDFSFQGITKLYTNDGGGNYTLVQGTVFDAVGSSAIAFADVDGDGDPDVLITGLNNSSQRIAKLYTNDGSGGFTLVSGTPFEGVQSSSIAFADIDGDGDLDVLITGLAGSGSANQRIARFYLNDGSGNYTLLSGNPVDGVSNGSIAFADIDGDGDPDLLITGLNHALEQITKLYTNNGSGIYSLVSDTPFTRVWYSSIAFADVDGDGDPDVLITGEFNFFTKIAKLYANDGSGIFTEVVGMPFEGVAYSSVAFADVDADGDPDVLITGLSLNQNVAKIYRNTSTTACPITASCAPFDLILTASGTATLLPEDVDDGSGVSCGTAILSLSQTEFDTTHIGENTVTLTVQDENGNSETCEAIVTVSGPPDPCRYFISNYNTQGGSDVYELTLNDDANTAHMSLLGSVPQKVNLSYSLTDNMLYLVQVNNAVFQTYNLNTGIPGLPIGVNVNISGFTGSAFGPDGMLYAASQTSGAIYRVDPSTLTGSFFSQALVNGGDMDFTDNGELILLSRSPAQAFVVNENGPNTILGSVPSGVSGLARRGDGTFLLSVQGYGKLIVGSTSEGDPGIRYDLMLNGVPFTPADGDLASGCPLPSGDQNSLNETNLPENNEVRTVLSSQPNPTDGRSVAIFTSNTDTRARLEVYDMSGRVVANLFDAVVQAGMEYRTEFDGRALPNGVYIYRLTTEHQIVTHKLIIAH